MARKILSLLIVCFATASSTLMALGLGEIKLKSGLNQPLDAEIQLVSVRGESNDQLIGTLGSRETFERSGIDRLYFLTKISFTTITKPNGQKVLHLTTENAVREPFLNFLVNLEWPNGRLLREYTLLLDPPVFDDAPPARVTPPPVTPKPQPRKEAETVREPEVVTQSQWEGEIYGPTSSDDTLWGIAAKVRPDRSISMQRAMVTIFEANPDAFMRGNINRLKRGAEIRVPDTSSFEDISQRDALRIIAAHNENWKSGKRTKPTVVVDTSSDDSYQPATESKSYDSGRLSLSSEDSETGTNEGGSSVKEALTEEENEVLKQQNEVLQDRAQTDADRIEQLERLLQLKDEQLANIQNRTNEEKTDVATETAISPEPTVEEQSAKPVIQEETPKVVSDKKVAPVQQTQSKPAKMSLMDGIMSGAYNLYLAIAGGVVFLLLIISIVRRKGSSVDYKDAVANASHSTKADSGSRDEPVNELPVAADDVLAGTDSMEFEETEMQDSDSSDPLGEADIYIAYGKFDQAEKLLLKTIEDNPERVELNSKLLECYAEMDAKDKFEAQLDNISSAMEMDTELAKYIEELYQTTWPEGELFGSLSEFEDEGDEIDDTFDEEIDDILEDDIVDAADDSEEDIYEADDSDEDIEQVEDLPSTEDVFGDIAEEDVDIAAEDELDDFDETDFDSDEFDDIDLDSEEESDIETQLDLARAYVEMGDTDGTKEIIAEIMETGTDEQREEAQKILDSLED